MNNRNRKNNGFSSTLGIGIIALVMLLNMASGAAMGNFAALIAAVVILGAAGILVGVLYAKKKGGEKKGSVYHAERAKESAKRMFMREEYEQKETAVKCTHPRGREKYIHQLDNFLSTGLIDKKEYQVLRTRYEKMNIPDDIH